MKIRSCSPVPTSSPRIIAFPSYIRLERRLIHSLSIGQGTFLSNPSHRPDHIEVMDGTMDDWPGDLPGQDYQQRRKNIVPVLGIRASNQKMKNPKAGSN